MEDRNTNECCICLDINNMDKDNTIYIINNDNNDKNVDICNCNINLHSSCFFMWFKKHRSCPICRNTISRESIYFNNNNDFGILDSIYKESNKPPIPSEDILNIVLEQLVNQNVPHVNHHVQPQINNPPEPNPHGNRAVNRNRNRTPRLYNPFSFLSYFRST